MLTYRDALLRVFQHTDLEYGERPPYAERIWRLEHMENLLHAFGDPHLAYPSVHVAGTKGKGSTTAMIEAVLRAAGYRTGMYTSPHLHTFRERIRVGGQLIPEADLATTIADMQPVLDQHPEATVFEIITALAMVYFRQQAVDCGVFEVGMGGRLDSTNVLHPLVSVITSISIDHVAVLGSTLAAIAREKAGIIKRQVPAVSSPQKPEALQVIEQTCYEREAPLTLAGRDWCWRLEAKSDIHQTLSIYQEGNASHPEYPDMTLPLLGGHQLENACVAVAAIEALRAQGMAISRQAVRQGLATVQWPGRLEILGRAPLVVVDGAHNGDSMQRLLQALRGYLTYARLLIVFGAGRTHAPQDLLGALLPAADHLWVTQSHHPKAMPAAELVSVAQQAGTLADVSMSVREALMAVLACAGPQDLVLVTGSLFVVAEAREAWAALQGWPPYPADPPGVY